MSKIHFIILLSASFITTLSADPDLEINVENPQHHTSSSGIEGNTADSQLLQTIQTQIQNQYRHYNLSIRVTDGKVAIRGYVRSEEDKKNIEELVHSIPGVKTISNEIEVREN